MALVVSASQLERILKEDGTLELFPSYTEHGELIYVNACQGEPVAKVHIGEWNGASKVGYLHVGHLIHKIDSVGPVDFFPSYSYLSREAMLYGKMDRFYQSVLKAVQRPCVNGAIFPSTQFFGDSHSTPESQEADRNLWRMFELNEESQVVNLCQQQNMNLDRLKAYMNARNLTGAGLFQHLRAKWGHA